MQQQVLSSPDAMRNMEQFMSGPVMEGLLSNPEVLRSLVQSNPQLRSLMDRNPELAHVLNDPETLRQTMEVARNPELLREQMRNTDRTMSNIEAHPEGFNMLRRMYEDVQEPLMDAARGGDGAANPFAAMFGGGTGARGAAAEGAAAASVPPPTQGAPNTQPLPNPWAPAGATGAAGGGAPGGAGPEGANTGSLDALFGGMGGLGGLGGAGGGPPDMEAMQRIMENPAMSQALDQVLSQPGVFQSIVNANPQARALMESNPEMARLMEDPETLRRLTNPDNMRAMMQIQEGMRQLQSNGLPMGPLGGMGLGGGLGPGGLGLGGVGAAAAPGEPAQPPEERFEAQLNQLRDMGFFDQQENIRVLLMVGGNVNAAVETLLSSGRGP